MAPTASRPCNYGRTYLQGRTDGFDMTFDPFVSLHYSFSLFSPSLFTTYFDRGVTNWDSNRPLSLPRCSEYKVVAAAAALRTRKVNQTDLTKTTRRKGKERQPTVTIERTKDWRCIIHGRSFSDRFPDLWAPETEIKMADTKQLVPQYTERSCSAEDADARNMGQ